MAATLAPEDGDVVVRQKRGNPSTVYHTALLTRIRAEYLEMPGLRLTCEQAQRLCGADRLLCQRVLDMLVDVTFLCTNVKAS
jgi:hypothetical protein